MDIEYIHILLIVDGTIFFLGVFVFIIGVIILTSRAMGREMHSLASATSKLAQKGIAEDIAGLVGNASALMNALQQMVKTAAGIGVMLILIGTIFITGSVWIFLNIDQFTFIL